MFRIYPGEVFKEIPLNYPLQKRYSISNRGRLVSYDDDIKSGTELKGSSNKNYKVFRFYVTQDGERKSVSLFFHKLIAELFLSKYQDDQQYIIHIDHDRTNNDVRNLKWVNYQEKINHYRKSPKVIKAKQKWSESNLKLDGHKLSATKVIHLKKLINDPNRKTRLKLLAKKFGISEMQLYRIKRGENWRNVEF
ncbi:MAG: HNH endonuclease [Flavobacterium sp.]|nr:HNH endonuclease [Flavobacterium sp.]MBF0694656.1 HNH endonuclease [Flavobacterium sp.]